MTDFDPLKAIREELAGLADVEKTIKQRERACEEAISAAEGELNAVRKLRGYVRIQIDEVRERLKKLEQEH
jgi:hypothetical protein